MNAIRPVCARAPRDRVFRLLCAVALAVLASACARDGGDTGSTRHASAIRFAAPGMHCENCVRTLETTLRKLPGVDSASANLDRKDVIVFVDTVETPRARIAMVIERLGFDKPLEEAAE